VGDQLGGNGLPWKWVEMGGSREKKKYVDMLKVTVYNV
jgi:hypothetical protein